MCQACIIRFLKRQRSLSFFIETQFEQFVSKMRLTGIYTFYVYRIIQLYYILKYIAKLQWNLHYH